MNTNCYLVAECPMCGIKKEFRCSEDDIICPECSGGVFLDPGWFRYETTSRVGEPLFFTQNRPVFTEFRTITQLLEDVESYNKRQFGVDELWSLDYSIAVFIYPRLKRYASDLCAHPGSMTMDDWKLALRKMLAAFRCLTREKNFDHSNTDLARARNKIISEGLDLFRKHYFDLWD